MWTKVTLDDVIKVEKYKENFVMTKSVWRWEFWDIFISSLVIMNFCWNPVNLCNILTRRLSMSTSQTNMKCLKLHLVGAWWRHATRVYFPCCHNYFLTDSFSRQFFIYSRADKRRWTFCSLNRAKKSVKKKEIIIKDGKVNEMKTLSTFYN